MARGHSFSLQTPPRHTPFDLMQAPGPHTLCICNSTQVSISMKTGPLTLAFHTYVYALSLRCPMGTEQGTSDLPTSCICGNHPHPPGSARTTSADSPSRKAMFCKLKSDLESLYQASQSSSPCNVLSPCHLLGMPAQIESLLLCLPPWSVSGASSSHC